VVAAVVVGAGKDPAKRGLFFGMGGGGIDLGFVVGVY